MVQGEGCVEQGDAELGAGGNVDLVVAGTGSADDDEVGRGMSQSGTLEVGTENDQAVQTDYLIGCDFQRVEVLPVIGVIPTGRRAEALKIAGKAAPLLDISVEQFMQLRKNEPSD